LINPLPEQPSARGLFIFSGCVIFRAEDNIMRNKTNRPSGMFGFSLVWLG
jgi:hypothetical protein